jgi:hypothetical protein
MSKKILCLDFDGVMHSYTSGWLGAAVITDPAVPGLFEFLEAVKGEFDIQVFSSRSHQDGGVEAMLEWVMAERKLWRERGGKPPADTPLTLSFPKEKPAAFVSIDDRAITFNGQWPSLETLVNFEPWNKRLCEEPAIDRLAINGLIAQAIKSRLQEAVVVEILPKPSIAELEKLVADSAREDFTATDIGTLLSDGSLVRSHKKPVFAADLADAAISAIYDGGFKIVPNKV